MGLDISSGHPLGIHRQNLFLDVLTDAGLVLFQHLRLKLAFPVPGYGYFYIAKARTQRLTAVSIAAVIRVLIFVVILAAAQFVIQFRLQAVLHEFGYGQLPYPLFSPHHWRFRVP